jgi:hypothetical protein
MINDTTLAIGAIAAVLGLLELVVVETISVQQQAKARGCESGNAGSLAFNASKGLASVISLRNEYSIKLGKSLGM